MYALINTGLITFIISFLYTDIKRIIFFTCSNYFDVYIDLRIFLLQGLISVQVAVLKP